jgi:uncharacterized cupredoxin-like copper-binding protein
MSRRVFLAAAFVAVFVAALVASGCGGGDSSTVASTVTITGTEMAFSPSSVTVAAGKHRFVLDNQGAAYHELAIEAPDGSVRGRAMAAPGERAELVADLDAGTYEMVCREPGHYEAGMRGTLAVT